MKRYITDMETGERLVCSEIEFKLYCRLNPDKHAHTHDGIHYMFYTINKKENNNE